MPDHNIQKPCKLKSRKDDIPKRSKEKSWQCETCGALLFGEKKPVCVRVKYEQARAQIKLETKRLNLKD